MSVSVVSSPRRFDKTLLVSSERCAAIEKHLIGAGCIVTKVNDGGKAVSRIRREIFDAAVLVSTGQEMDLAETVFNLRDISSSTAIVIVADGAEVSANLIREITTAVPNITIVNLQRLKILLEIFRGTSPPKMTR